MMYDFGLGSAFSMGTFPAAFILLLAWSLFWKGLALWHSGRRGEVWWFIALLLVNTVGVLEIVYLFFVAERRPGNLFKKD